MQVSNINHRGQSDLIHAIVPQRDIPMMQGSAARYKRAHVLLLHREYGKFVAQYARQNPTAFSKATDDELYEEYLKTRQSKQAMNTRLLGG